MIVLPALFLLVSLFLCGHVEAQSSTSEMLRESARKLPTTTLNHHPSTQYIHIPIIFILYIIRL